MLKEHKGKIWTAGGAVAILAGGITIWTFLGLPTIVFSHTLEAKAVKITTQVEKTIDPLVLAGQDYLEQRDYNLRREHFNLRDKLSKLRKPNLTSHERERKNMIEELLKSNELRRQKLKRLQRKLNR